jgi:hypothetical protein
MATKTASKVAVSLSIISLFASIPRTGFIVFPPDDVSDFTSEALVRQAGVLSLRFITEVGSGHGGGLGICKRFKTGEGGPGDSIHDADMIVAK